MIEIDIAQDYTDTPGGRFKSQGPFSGEEFREILLIPKYREAKEKKETLLINMDGCFGYPSSFYNEAFVGLAKAEKSRDIFKIIQFICNDQPGLVEKIKKDVADVNIEE